MFYLETKICYFQDPPTVYKAVGRLEVAVKADLRIVQKDHAPDDVEDQGGHEHVVQGDIVVVQHVSAWEIEMPYKLGQWLAGQI